jgi:hypothetical protein
VRDEDEDRSAIESVIADIERGFTTKDPELSVEDFLPEAWALTVAPPTPVRRCRLAIATASTGRAGDAPTHQARACHYRRHGHRPPRP